MSRGYRARIFIYLLIILGVFIGLSIKGLWFIGVLLLLSVALSVIVYLAATRRR